MEKWWDLMRFGEAGDIEARMRRHDGVFRWFLIRFEPYRDETGKIVMWYGVSTDIETLKQTEEKYREDNASFGKLRTQYLRRSLSRTRPAYRSTPIGRLSTIRA